MKIAKETSGLMILKDRNIDAYFMGIVFLLAGIAVILKPNLFANQLPLWSGFVGILFGGFVVLATKSTMVKLDKSTNKLVFLQKGITGQNSKEYDLNQIKEIELSVAYNDSRNGGGYSYHLAFVFSNGEIVPLNPGSSSTIRIMGRQIIPEKTLGAKIATFLGVPFQERRPPTVDETLSAVSSAIQSVAEKEIKKQKNI